MDTKFKKLKNIFKLLQMVMTVSKGESLTHIEGICNLTFFYLFNTIENTRVKKENL
jgi:homoserine dehydrogenase